MDAIAQQLPDVEARVLPPRTTEDVEQVSRVLGFPLPECLKSLYTTTSGIDMRGYSEYLPDRFGKNQLTFSLLPLEEIPDWYKIMVRNAFSRGPLWDRLPHLLKVITVSDEADGLWKSSWIPFATDGAAGVQFVVTKWPHGVFQYDPGTFQISRCGSSLAQYLTTVAARIRSRKLEVLEFGE